MNSKNNITLLALWSIMTFFSSCGVFKKDYTGSYEMKGQMDPKGEDIYGPFGGLDIKKIEDKTPWKQKAEEKNEKAKEDYDSQSDIDTPKKKSAYTVFHKLVFNLRRLLQKIPLGKSLVARYGAALYLIKEHTHMSEKQIRKIMDKVETEFDWDNLPLQESNWFQSIDGKLNPGSYILVQDIASPLTGELIAKANSRIKVTEQIEPHDTFLGMSIYKVKHQTGQDIYITNGDIVR